MPASVPLRRDFDARHLRKLASRCKDARQSRRLLSLAAVYDGMSRGEAARIGGMDRQTLRDWVHRFNEEGPDGLTNRKGAGRTRYLSDVQMKEPCLSGCHPHPLYVWRGVEWPGRGTKRGWMSRSVKTFRFRGRFLSSSDFSRMARPVPPKLQAMSPLPLTPSFTRAIGSTLDVVGVGDNRIGTERTWRDCRDRPRSGGGRGCPLAADRPEAGDRGALWRHLFRARDIQTAWRTGLCPYQRPPAASQAG